jgi:hypothetical protein
VAELEAAAYAPADAIPRALLHEWYESNPTGFNILRRARDRSRLGHADVLTVRPAALEKLLAGSILERELRGTDLYSPAESASIRNLYIESVAFADQEARSIGPAVRYLVRNFIRLVGRICAPSQVERVYAIAATERGRRFMRHLGFEPLRETRAEAGPHQIFAASFVALTSRIAELCHEPPAVP